MAEFRVTVPTAGNPVTCRDDQTILDAFLRNGVWLPNSCNQGTCGTCKLRVVAGHVDHAGSPEYTLTAAERAQGLALGCQSRPRSDLVVEPLADTTDAVARFPLRDLTATVVSLDPIARDTRRLVLEADGELDFLPGQYAQLHVPGTECWRPYSMANSPARPHRLEFHIRYSDGGVATGWIFHGLTVGDRVELRGPLGDFVLDDADHPLLLLAGGTGLAPLSAMLRAALERGHRSPIHLYHGVREEADLYDVEWLSELSRSHPDFHYTPCLSRGEWNGRTGYVGDAVLADFDNLRDYSGYLCGPPAMVEAAGRALKRRRMAPRRIFREKFTDAVTVGQELASA
ncbi:2Fe-2S iron-sulfur cluster-binding protein [Nocardia farcinica]|uniref:Phenol hydroxylase P5 protein n=1 Tax=Nocardia farcinica TaxID=37329 RepID=A0A449HC89_NOCFR|nr:2Fe-2S iron-sulfur cluster-binding protein [Nocardia farcinica]VFA95571.1 Phenol hydroxylase P5 protein [Nocardia farcinica]